MGVGLWGVSRGLLGAQVRSGSCVGLARAQLNSGLSVEVARAPLKPGLCVKGARDLHCSQGMRLRQDPRLGTGNEFNYEEVIKNFQCEVPEHFNFSRDVIDKFAATDGSRDALWYVGEADGSDVKLTYGGKSEGSDLKLTYGQLSEASHRAAAVVEGLGARRAVVILPKVPEWWLINVASIRCGTVLLPGTTQLTERDIEGRLLASGADSIICDEETAAKVDRLTLPSSMVTRVVVGAAREARLSGGWLRWEELYMQAGPGHKAVDSHKDDIMQIFFTSGTTGKPKMVPHTHGSYGYCHWPMGRYWLDLTPGDLMWNISDTGWAKSAWSGLFGPWSQGATVFVHGMSRFTSPKILDTLAQYPVSVLCAPPTMYRSLVQEDLSQRTFQRLRHCVSAGEPLNEEVIFKWEEATGLVVKEGYGQTETTLLLGTFKKMSKWVKPGSIGKVAPGYDVRIVNNMGIEVPRGQQGNIGVRCKPKMPPGLFQPLWSQQARALKLSQGYCEDLQATANCFAGDFYLTGDRGSQDEDGYFWFFSRVDDLIISSGYRIGPFEVESALIEHEAVLESAVVPSPDVERGQVVKAFVVLSDKFKHVRGAPEMERRLVEELQEHVRTTTAPYKYPRKIEFVPSLPKTVSGKIRRTELRSQETREIHA